MGFETTHLFKRLELWVETDGDTTVEVYTDKPGDDLSVRHTEMFDTSDTTTGRRTFRVRLPADVRGKLYRIRVMPSSVMRLHGGRILVKPMSSTRRTAWHWRALPIPETPSFFSDFPRSYFGRCLLWPLA